MLGWLEMRGVATRRLDVTTASGLAEAAWLDLADLGQVPVLVLLAGVRELGRWVGRVPGPRELRPLLREAA